MPKFYEFFSGGGMARLGLGDEWKCLLANDICPKKVSTYIDNFGQNEVICKDIYALNSDELPGEADLIWGSFPCQDLSLAGNGAGLNGERSGTFKKLVSLIADLKKEKRQPKIVVLENVVGAITSHNGRDFFAIMTALTKLGYHVGAMVIDGALFVPQSRPRLFIIATKTRKSKLGNLASRAPNPNWHPQNLVLAHDQLSTQLKKKWVWWNLALPQQRTINLIDVIEADQNDVALLPPKEVDALLNMMSDVNITKVNKARKQGHLQVGALYKRVRAQADGTKLQRAEVRFDNLAGCLRTPTGGSSRQTLLFIDGDNTAARLLTRRETARLMGVPETYNLPLKYNDAYHVFGDGLVVPAVAWLESNILRPLSQLD
ncbi:DNA cytosine methyltransferase [Rheinheimera fenheensis]|uniref:DNA cytosine methyltransferase n=1 Tax=Rheinheimera fenheensis TaxID=3152295 RepID=UPI0032611AE0